MWYGTDINVVHMLNEKKKKNKNKLYKAKYTFSA